jgi:hypothetical protein
MRDEEEADIKRLYFNLDGSSRILHSSIVHSLFLINILIGKTP